LATTKEITAAAIERLRWAQNNLDEIKMGGGMALDLAKTHVHSAMEILKQVPVGN
jgi:hypothetical protein